MAFMKRSTLSHSFLNIVLVFIESALTLLLRLDPALRRAAYPLAKQGTRVCLRLYLPHIEVFATFSYKGVLLDLEQPEGSFEPDVVINAYSLQVLMAIATHDDEATEKLQMRGDNAQVQLVKQFITQLGLGSLLHSIINKIKGGKATKASDVQKAEKADSYKRKISEQQAQISSLTIKNRELETTVKELESKQKMFMIAAIVMTVVAIGAILGWILT